MPDIAPKYDCNGTQRNALRGLIDRSLVFDDGEVTEGAQPAGGLLRGAVVHDDVGGL